MKKVFLAAGHYPSSPGAGFEGFYEHDEAVRWVQCIAANETHDALGQESMYVVVPTGDLRSKAQFINARVRPGDIAVEIHFNSAVDRTTGERIGSGCVTLYMPNSALGRVLAEECQSALVEAIGNKDRGVVEGWYRGDRSKGPYYFLERTRCPAVILEPEFVHRKDVITGCRTTACAALHRAFCEYLKGGDL